MRIDDMDIVSLEKQAILISDKVEIIKKFLLSEFYLTEKIKIIKMSVIAVIIITLGCVLENQASFAILLSLSLLSSLYYFSLKVTHRKCTDEIRKCENLTYDIMIFRTVELCNNEAKVLSEERLINFQDRADELQWGVK